jgi:integrase/recombinase XerD
MARTERLAKHKPNESVNLNDPQGMWVLMEQFFEWLRVKNYSEKTIEVRKVYLGYFINWCADRGVVRPAEVTKPIIERYQRFMYHYRKRNGDPLSFRSQHGRLVPIRAWFKWLTRNNYILYNPASEIELPKLGHRLPKHILSQSEAEEVINTANVSKPTGVRDRAILETLYSTGIRRSELINLRVFDLDADRGTLMVRQGKGGKDRMIPIGERAVAWIERYLVEVRPTLISGDAAGDFVFLNNNGQPFTANALTLLVREYITKADVGKQGSCHLFRHTMATLMLENGADIRYIQAMLGHVKLETTAIYTQVSIRKLKEIHTATHPARMERKPPEKTNGGP